MLNFLKEFSHSESKKKTEEKEKAKEFAFPKEDLSKRGGEVIIKDEEVEKVSKGVSDVTLMDKKVKVESVEEPVIVEKEVEIPVVKEKIIPQVKELVQPVIMRDTEKIEVHHITQPLSSKNVLPTQLVKTELPLTTMPDTIEKPREEDVSKYYKAHNREESSTEILEPQVTRTVLPPIVKERITPIIHEEVQPVIYQETIQPVVVTENKPFYHHVVEAPKVVEEIRPMKSIDDARSLLERVGTTTVKETILTGQSSIKKEEKQKSGQQ